MLLPTLPAGRGWEGQGMWCGPRPAVPFRAAEHCNATVQAAYGPFIEYLKYLADHRLSVIPASIIEHHLKVNNL